MSVRRLAKQCLDLVPPLSLRRDIFTDVDGAPLSLQARLREIHENC